MEDIKETKDENIFDIVGEMDDCENFHISVEDGVIDKIDEEMVDADGNPMAWGVYGDNWFEKALLGYADCYGKLTKEVIAKVQEKQYADAIKLLGINNILTFYHEWSETIILKDYCFCDEKYLERYRSTHSYIADNEKSTQCKKY